MWKNKFGRARLVSCIVGFKWLKRFCLDIWVFWGHCVKRNRSWSYFWVGVWVFRFSWVLFM